MNLLTTHNQTITFSYLWRGQERIFLYFINTVALVMSGYLLEREKERERKREREREREKEREREILTTKHFLHLAEHSATPITTDFIVSGIPDTLTTTDFILSGTPDTLTTTDFILSGTPDTFITTDFILSGTPDTFIQNNFK